MCQTPPSLWRPSSSILSRMIRIISNCVPPVIRNAECFFHLPSFCNHNKMNLTVQFAICKRTTHSSYTQRSQWHWHGAHVCLVSCCARDNMNSETYDMPYSISSLSAQLYTLCDRLPTKYVVHINMPNNVMCCSRRHTLTRLLCVWECLVHDIEPVMIEFQLHISGR